MSRPNYRYYLTIDSVETEVSPYGEWSLEIKPAKEDFPWCKDYRIKFGGDLTFSGVDYDLIINRDCCNGLTLRITCNGKDYWVGYFAWPYDFEIDENTCTIKGTPKPVDKYYYFDLFAGSQYELLDRTDTFTYQNNFPTAAPGDTWSVCLPCEPLWDVITRICTNLPCEPTGFTYTVKSTFFQNDLFPDGTNPYPVNNYATGFSNNLNYIVMAMAQDICDLDTAAPDLLVMPEFSWNDIMELVHNVFNTWWYIDENGEIRIEHIYFWELYFTADYDLTVMDGGNWLVNTDKYHFLTSEIPIQEQWIYNRLGRGAFPTIASITYDCNAPGIANYIKEYNLDSLAYDIEYAAPGTNNFATSPAACDDIDDNCYMLIRCVTYAQAVAAGVTPTVCTYCAWPDDVIRAAPFPPLAHVNGHMYGHNLLINYWTYDRPLWQGDMNQLNITGITFNSVAKNLKQVQLSFPICCDSEAEIVLTGGVSTNPRYLYDFLIIIDTIITQFGEGDVYNGVIENGMLSVELIFEDQCSHGDPTSWASISDL